MKLSNEHITRATGQIDAKPIAETHPVMPQFAGIFGDHTFFLDGEGLSIIEPAEPQTDGMSTGRIVKVARWSDASHRQLMPHQREFTDVFVALGKAA